MVESDNAQRPTRAELEAELEHAQRGAVRVSTPAHIVRAALNAWRVRHVVTPELALGERSMAGAIAGVSDPSPRPRTSMKRRSER